MKITETQTCREKARTIRLKSEHRAGFMVRPLDVEDPDYREDTWSATLTVIAHI